MRIKFIYSQNILTSQFSVEIFSKPQRICSDYLQYKICSHGNRSHFYCGLCSNLLWAYDSVTVHEKDLKSLDSHSYWIVETFDILKGVFHMINISFSNLLVFSLNYKTWSPNIPEFHFNCPSLKHQQMQIEMQQCFPVANLGISKRKRGSCLLLKNYWRDLNWDKITTVRLQGPTRGQPGRIVPNCTLDALNGHTFKGLNNNYFQLQNNGHYGEKVFHIFRRLLFFYFAHHLFYPNGNFEHQKRNWYTHNDISN